MTSWIYSKLGVFTTNMIAVHGNIIVEGKRYQFASELYILAERLAKELFSGEMIGKHFLVEHQVNLYWKTDNAQREL